MKKIIPTQKKAEPTKHCDGCSQTLPLSSFHKNGDNGVHTDCGTCRQKARAEENHDRKEGNKRCPGCGIDQPTTNFSAEKRESDGVQTKCKVCQREARIKYLSTFDGFITNLCKNLRSNEKKKGKDVKITADDVRKLYTKQKGKCAVTGEQMTYTASDRKTDKQSATNKSNISIKKIDALKEYTIDNIQLVCSSVSTSKK